MRDRLIELMRNADNDKNLGWYDLYDLCRGKGCAEYFADYLIANGVTVQEWISVKDRLPEKNADVLIYNIEEYVGTDFLTKDGKWFWNEELPPTHWMPLPQPPKGE